MHLLNLNRNSERIPRDLPRGIQIIDTDPFLAKRGASIPWD
jgi:hypothetical protein